MGERRQIARRADRALRRHRRRHAGRQHPFQGFDDGPLHAGSAAAEAEQLQGHRQANDPFRQVRPDAGIVGEDQIALQLRGLFRRNAGAGQFAEAGVDAVNGFVALGRPRDDRFRARHVRPAGAVEQDRRALAVQRFQGRQRNRSGRQRDRFGHQRSCINSAMTVRYRARTASSPAWRPFSTTRRPATQTSLSAGPAFVKTQASSNVSGPCAASAG